MAPDYISLNFMNKPSLCVVLGLKSTDQSFLEAVIAHDLVITAKSRRSCDSALWNTGGGCWQTMQDGANPQRNRSQMHKQQVESRG